MQSVATLSITPTLELHVVHDDTTGTVICDAAGPVDSSYVFDTDASDVGEVRITLPTTGSGALIVDGTTHTPIGGSVSFTVNAGSSYDVDCSWSGGGAMGTVSDARKGSAASTIRTGGVVPTTKVVLKPRRTKPGSGPDA